VRSSAAHGPIAASEAARRDRGSFPSCHPHFVTACVGGQPKKGSPHIRNPMQLLFLMFFTEAVIFSRFEYASDAYACR
jgi:hypothetical protein